MWNKKHIQNNVSPPIMNNLNKNTSRDKKGKYTMKHLDTIYSFNIQKTPPNYKTNKIPTFHLFLSLFVTYWQRLPNQKIDRKHTQQSKRKYRKKGTQNDSTLGNRDNSPYEEQRLKKSFSPYKNRKNKTSFGKNCFGETLGGGENKDTQTKL